MMFCLAVLLGVGELQRACSCSLTVGGFGRLPAGLACGGFTGLDQQVVDELGSLHLVELLDAGAEELCARSSASCFSILLSLMMRKMKPR
jgi:hypothetical protein